MLKLDHTHYAKAYDSYRKVPAFFPLIGAVLLNEQDGAVYADDRGSPQRIYVEHAFGFAQVCGRSCPSFDLDLERYLVRDRCFAAPKARLYTPCLPGFLDDVKWESQRSFRQRFSLDADLFSVQQTRAINGTTDFEAISVDRHLVGDVERLFGVVGRFWRSPADFVRKACGVLALYQGRPAAICYAAAEADRRVEVDVLTLPEYRRLGAGRVAVRHFVACCLQKSLVPVWDCFANNVGSMQLARAVGFVATDRPYPFFTIAKS